MTKDTTDTAKAVDLSSFDTVAACNNPARVELVHPITKAPLGVFFYILGKDSDAVQEHIRTSVNTNMRRDALDARRGKHGDVPTVEKGEAANIATLTVAVFCGNKAWETTVGETTVQTVNLGGQDLSFSLANVKRVLTEQKWIAKQVDDAVGDLELFIPA